MYIFINRMRPNADTTQYMISLKNDGRTSIPVYSAFVHWDSRQQYFFVVRRGDAGLFLHGTPSLPGPQPTRRDECQAALDTFFDENMVDANRWPREGWGHETMQNMTFMIIYEARDLDPLTFLCTLP